MEFEVSSCYTRRGKIVLNDYPQLEKYPHRLEKNKLYITINSLDELLKIQKEIKENLILDQDGELVIYDGYVE